MFVNNHNSQCDNPNPWAFRVMGTDHKFFVGLKLTRSIWNTFALVANVSSSWSFVDAKRTAQETRAASNYLLSCTDHYSPIACTHQGTISVQGSCTRIIPVARRCFSGLVHGHDVRFLCGWSRILKMPAMNMGKIYPGGPFQRSPQVNHDINDQPQQVLHKIGLPLKEDCWRAPSTLKVMSLGELEWPHLYMVV